MIKTRINGKAYRLFFLHEYVFITDLKTLETKSFLSSVSWNELKENI